MPVCRKCGYQNREDVKYCVNCGNILELTEADIERQKSRQTAAITTWAAYFLILMGFCTFFGGAMTYVTSMGTIIQNLTAQIATPYILIGCVLMFFGALILFARAKD